MSVQSVLIICLRITDKFSINLCRLPLLVGQQHSIPFISATTVKARATSRIRIPIPLSPPSHNKTHTVCIDLLAACPRKSLIARPTSHTKSSARSLCRHPVAAPTRQGKLAASLNLVLPHSLTSDKQRSQHRRRVRILRASIHPDEEEEKSCDWTRRRIRGGDDDDDGTNEQDNECFKKQAGRQQLYKSPMGAQTVIVGSIILSARTTEMPGCCSLCLVVVVAYRECRYRYAHW